MPEAHLKPGVLPLSQSDHYIAYTVVGGARRRSIKPNKSKHRTAEVGNFNQCDPLCFNSDLMILNLHHVVNDVNKIDNAWKL